MAEGPQGPSASVADAAAGRKDRTATRANRGETRRRNLIKCILIPPLEDDRRSSKIICAESEWVKWQAGSFTTSLNGMLNTTRTEAAAGQTLSGGDRRAAASVVSDIEYLRARIRRCSPGRGGKSGRGWRRFMGVLPPPGSLAPAPIACGGLVTARTVAGRKYHCRPVWSLRNGPPRSASRSGCLARRLRCHLFDWAGSRSGPVHHRRVLAHPPVPLAYLANVSRLPDIQLCEWAQKKVPLLISRKSGGVSTKKSGRNFKIYTLAQRWTHRSMENAKTILAKKGRTEHLFCAASI